MGNDQDSALAARLEACYTGAVFDVLRSMGYRGQVLPHCIRPLDPQKRLAGPVYTVAGHLNRYLDDHETLIRWTDFLSRAPSGSVVICQPHDSANAHMGELSAETLHFRGVRGYIVDGGCRDTDFILKLGFPVFCRYCTPADIVGRWSMDLLGEPITIGEVGIRTGDYVLADRDGVVILPREMAGDVVARTEEVMQTENRVRVAILAGMDPKDAYLQFGKF